MTRFASSSRPISSVESWPTASSSPEKAPTSSRTSFQRARTLPNSVSRRITSLRRSKNLRSGVPIKLDAIHTNAMPRAPSATDAASIGQNVLSSIRSIAGLARFLTSSGAAFIDGLVRHMRAYYPD
jgi:hypothetical protein